MILRDALPGEPQTSSAVLMIRPAHFGGNVQTRDSNYFQHDAEGAEDDVATQARHEFDAFAGRLAMAGVDVVAFAGHRDAALPDEVFPNNWLSLHADGAAVLYPLMAENRRAERRVALLDALRERGFRIERVVDLSSLEDRGQYLEGTGSLVLDRRNRIAYACRSPRTHPAALEVFGRELGYEIVEFAALDRRGRPIYHTNVVMSVGANFVALCSAAVDDAAERRRLLDRLGASSREILDLSLDQLHAFAGNLLELRGTGPVIAMSMRALQSLTAAQQAMLERHGEIVAAELECIELFGGGSARCMLAEIACPRSGER
jgi:hypothetical protein